MLNLCWMLLTVGLGVSLLWMLRKKSELLKIIVIIATFSISRIFFRFAWQSVTGGVTAVFPTADVYVLLLLNFFLLSLFFIAAVNYLTNRKFNSLGWTSKNLGIAVLSGVLVGGVLFFLLSFHKSLSLAKLPGTIFFAFFIASWQEENIFRGHLVAYLNQRFGRTETIIYQALIFTLAHLGFYPVFPITNMVVSLAAAFVFGLIFGFLRVITKSQVPGFIVHGMVDVAFLL